jgi:outer membrane protein OmpA-like peptidoglycan-associated protein
MLGAVAAPARAVDQPDADAERTTKAAEEEDVPPTRRLALPLAVAGAAVVPLGLLGLAAGLGVGAVGVTGTVVTPRWPDGAVKPFPNEPIDLAQARVWTFFGLLVAGPVVAALAVLPLAVGTAFLVGAVVMRFLPATGGPATGAPTVTPAAAAPPAASQPESAPAVAVSSVPADSTPATTDLLVAASQPVAPVAPPADKDEDGVVDDQDRCPDQPGPQENQGCPWPDTDGDTVTDNVDACPRLAGEPDNRGCPWGDQDKDGLADNIDRCPQEAGPADNGGCPRVGSPESAPGAPPQAPLDPRCMVPENLAVQIKGDQILIPTKIQFAPGTATILGGSVQLLDQVALTLKCRIDITKLRIDGHTDDTGSDALNLKLSENRAKSVRDYLVRKGKVAPERLDFTGHGRTQPMVSNKDAAGREKNRRVEFVIVEVSK